jgi:hypothetical protein
MAEFSFSDLFKSDNAGGDIFGNMFGGGGTPTGLDALLTEDQRKLLSRNATLSAAAALLQASGRSPQRIGLGQALGSALQAGQGAYEKGRASSFQDLLLNQKLQEAEREAAGNESWKRFLGGNVSPVTATGVAQAMPTGPAVPTAERDMAMPMAAPAPSGILATLSPEQRALLTSLPRKEGVSEVLKMSQTQSEFGEPKPEVRDGKVTMVQYNKLGQSRIAPGVTSMGEAEFGEGRPEVRDGKTVMVQYNKLGQSRIATGAMPYEAQSPDIRAVEYISGTPLAGTGAAGIRDVGQYRQQTATRVDIKPVLDMTGGQKGFENEMKLASAFKQEPIYKDFSDMKSSFGQVVSSLSQGTPIGDVAGATKVMKLLDPGSVVRETELGIAMAAAGRMDRLNNYFSNMMTGQKLTPTQREDFKALSNELYAAAGQAYNQKRDEYKGFGEAYNFKNLDTALGAPATIPSLMRNAPGAGGGGRTRPSLGNIFQVPGG